MKKTSAMLFALALVLSLSLVTATPVMAADLHVGSGQPYATIQDAIDAASATDTIIVHDGTYTEDLTVNIADLTIESVNGAGSTTIQLVDGVGINVMGGADGFTLGGTSGQGFTILSGGSTTFDIQLENAPSGVEISYNTINTTGNATMGVSVGAAGASGLTVSNNTFIAESGDGSIWGPNIADVTVSDNIMSGGSYAIQFSGVTGTSAISDNTISGYTGSGGIVISNGGGTSGLTISDNSISSCSNGIYFVEYAPYAVGNMTTVTVIGNAISNSTNDAIKVVDGTHVLASNFSIIFNSISGSSNYGLENLHSSEVVTAEQNWWGDTSGPGGVGPGTGDDVTANVNYDPWLGAPVVVGGVHHETLGAGTDTVVDASAEAYTTVTLTTTGATEIYIALYVSQPFPEELFPGMPLGIYIDIHISNPENVTWPIYVEMSYASVDLAATSISESSLGLYYYTSPDTFHRCSDTGVDTTSNIIWANVTAEEAGYLAETPFAGGGTPAVGGEAYPINKTALLMTWIGLALALVIVVGGGVLLARRLRV